MRHIFFYVSNRYFFCANIITKKVGFMISIRCSQHHHHQHQLSTFCVLIFFLILRFVSSFMFCGHCTYIRLCNGYAVSSHVCTCTRSDYFLWKKCVAMGFAKEAAFVLSQKFVCKNLVNFCVTNLCLCVQTDAMNRFRQL